MEQIKFGIGDMLVTTQTMYAIQKSGHLWLVPEKAAKTKFVKDNAYFIFEVGSIFEVLSKKTKPITFESYGDSGWDEIARDFQGFESGYYTLKLLETDIIVTLSFVRASKYVERMKPVPRLIKVARHERVI